MDDAGGGGAPEAPAPTPLKPDKSLAERHAAQIAGCGPTAAPVASGCGGTKPPAVIPEGSNEEKEVIKQNYAKFYAVPKGDLERAKRLGYGERFISILPECLQKSFYGSANPWNLGDPVKGSTVVDFGSGLGIDCVLAARLGASRVVGIDLTPKAVVDATKTISALGFADTISFREGDLETTDLAKKLDLEGQADLVISNGVINLVDVKQKVFVNAFSFLKSGGWMRFSDMAMETPLPKSFYD